MTTPRKRKTSFWEALIDILLCFLVTGCATQNVSERSAVPVPQLAPAESSETGEIPEAPESPGSTTPGSTPTSMALPLLRAADFRTSCTRDDECVAVYEGDG